MLIYLNLPAEDQYEIWIPERAKLLMWPLTMSEVCPHIGLLGWFVDSLEYRQYSPYSCEVSLHLHQRSSFLYFFFHNNIIAMVFFSSSMAAAQAEYGDHELHLKLGKFRSLLQMWFVQMNIWRERINKERLLMCKWDAEFLIKSSRGAGGESDTKETNAMFSNYHLPAQDAVWFIWLTKSASSECG